MVQHVPELFNPFDEFKNKLSVLDEPSRVLRMVDLKIEIGHKRPDIDRMHEQIRRCTFIPCVTDLKAMQTVSATKGESLGKAALAFAVCSVKELECELALLEGRPEVFAKNLLVGSLEKEAEASRYMVEAMSGSIASEDLEQLQNQVMFALALREMVLANKKKAEIYFSRITGVGLAGMSMEGPRVYRASDRSGRN